jgi:O-antigen biosynthesis protein WbqP
MHKRLFDIMLSALLLMVLLGPMALIAIAVKFTSPGPVFFWSSRVGRKNKVFKMPKFRTMRKDSPVVATHLLRDPEYFITPIGRFLRRSSLDELPQLLSVIVGQMSLVGPRPALYNQNDLISLRTAKGIHELRPGISGLAQVRLRDSATIEKKVSLDEEYLHRSSFLFDVYIIGVTVLRVLFPKDVKH